MGRSNRRDVQLACLARREEFYMNKQHVQRSTCSELESLLLFIEKLCLEGTS